MGKWGRGNIPLTLRAKFTLVLLGVGVVPMLLIGIVSYFSSKSTIIRQATYIQQQALQQSLSSLDEKISMLEAMAGSFLLEDATKEMLNPSSSPDNLVQYGKEWTKFETMLNKHSFLNFTRSPMVTIFGYNGKVFSSWVSSGESLFDLLSRNQEFGRVVRAGGVAKLFWVAPHHDFSTEGSEAPQLSYVASVIDSTTGKEWGKIVISMDIDTLFAPFRDLLDQFTVYGPDQELIYSSSPHPIEAIYTGDEEFSFLKGGKITSGLARDARTGEKLLSIRGGMKNGWHIERIIPYKNILGEIASIRNFTLTFVLLATVMSILLGRVFIERILGPVRHLVYLMKQVGHGHWDDDPRIDADPELGILQKSFRQMTDNLKALQEENQHQQRVELELEFRALLSQIQPHFVKNTLAAINGLALQGDSTRILQLVDSLGYFLSTRIYQGRAIVPLEEELISLEHYLNIMRIRYPDKFEVQVHVSDALSHQSIVRFALQPIVENAIYHGMRSDSVLHIWIQAYDAGDVCTVVITDDGQGTDRDPLRERETDQELRGSLECASGIGLVNIDQRIRLYFGTAYGLSFESVIDGGTQVEICLPRQRMGDIE